MSQFCSELCCLGRLIFAAVLAVSLASSVSVIQGPEQQTKQERESVILHCRTEPGSDVRVIWQRDGVIVASSHIPATDRRYTFAGVADKGIHDLRIADLQIKDQGTYTCQVSQRNKDEKSWPALSTKAELRVLKNMDRVDLMQRLNATMEPCDLGQLARLSVGEAVEFVCLAQGSNPAPTVVWLFDGEERLTVPAYKKQLVKLAFEKPLKGVTWMERQDVTDKLSTVQAVLKLEGQSVTNLQHNLLVACQARVASDGQELTPMTASTRLYVMLPPTVTVTIEPARPGNEYHEHDRVMAVCSATGRPENFEYSWSVDSDSPQAPATAATAAAATDAARGGHQTSRRLALTLTRRHHGRSLRCQATNRAAKGEAVALMRVRYAPKFSPALPAIYAADLGGSVDMSCEADANPEPVYAWRRAAAPGEEGTGPIVGQMPRIRRSNIRPDDFGEYVCTASGAEFSPISRRVVLAEKSPPRCTSQGQQFARIARSFRLECRANSVPAPREADGVRWWRNGRRLETDSRVRIYREDFLGGTTGYVHFEEVLSTDFGIYNCTVENDVGRDSLLISLTIEDNIPIAFIAGASTALLMVLIFMLVLLCVCRKGYWESRRNAGMRDSRMKQHKLSGRQQCSDGGEIGNGKGNGGGDASDGFRNGYCRYRRSGEPHNDAGGSDEDSDDAPAANTAASVQASVASVDVGPGDIVGFPASPAFVGCAVHGSLGRQAAAALHHGHHQASLHHHHHLRPASVGAAAYPTIDLSDLTPIQQSSLGHALSPARQLQQLQLHQLSGYNGGGQHPQHQHQQHQQQHHIPEEQEETGQEDSVRSCDSGYGGAQVAALGHHPYPLGSSDSSVDSKLSGSAQHHVTFHPNPCVIHHYPAVGSLPKTVCPIHSIQHGLAAAAAGGSSVAICGGGGGGGGGSGGGVSGGIIRRQPTIDEDHPTTEV